MSTPKTNGRLYVGPGNACPVCYGPTDRYRHPPGWEPEFPGKLWYPLWDRCESCRKQRYFMQGTHAHPIHVPIHVPASLPEDATAKPRATKLVRHRIPRRHRVPAYWHRACYTVARFPKRNLPTPFAHLDRGRR